MTDSVMTAAARQPAVSIILPTYNRAAFLPAAVEAIRAQTFTDWELIVVDDGSTDDTEAVVAGLVGAIPQPVRYVRRENGGAYAARNTGLDLARGALLAFYDSDDVWLPHHLQDCAGALTARPDVDWVYGACRMVELSTGRVLSPNTFYADGRPRAFMSLRTRPDGRLRVIDDDRSLSFALREGLYNMLQNSVIRRRLFADRRFTEHYRNEAEDQMIVLRALAQGVRVAYFDNVHVIYHVHEANSSASAQKAPLEKRLQIYQALVRGFEELRGQVPLTSAQSRALNRRLGQEYFWSLGYSLLWQGGRREEALAMFRRGLRLWPWDLRCWKTYGLARLRSLAGGPAVASASP